MSEAKNIITAQSEQLVKLAQFVSASAPIIEKQAESDEFKSSFADFTVELAEKLASAGVIDSADIQDFASTVQESGFDKVAEAFDYVLHSATPASMGAPASEPSLNAAPLTSDQLWEQSFGV